MNLTLKKMLTALLPMLLLMFSSKSHAQVNTETLRKEDLQPGHHLTLGAQLNYLHGNSQVLQAKGNGSWYYVLDKGQVILNVNQKLSSKDNITFVNQGFIHLRGTRMIDHGLEGELYTQGEYNEFINLQSRQLLGAGLRKTLFTRDSAEHHPQLGMTLGTGLMFEEERMDAGALGDLGDPIHGEQARLVRASNYLIVTWTPEAPWYFTSTSYYQVDTQRLADFRVLSQSQLKVDLSQRLALEITWNLRYDSEPPANIESLDMEISQGLSYRFP